ncbi:MAG: AMP-binding protein [Micromonosporaceae bacterium]
MDLATLLDRAARRYRDRIAVEGPEGSLSFAELGDRVSRLARGLRSLGLRPGDRVLDLQINQNSFLETDLAIRCAGLVRVALNYRLHPDDWVRIAEDSAAAALIYDARFAEPAAPVVDGLDIVVAIGDAPGHPYQKLIDGQPGGALPALDDTALCGLHYSSGTTGRPKGARRTHRNWYASLVNMSYDVLGGPPGPDDVYLHAGPITHTSGLFVLPFLAAGAKQLILPSWDPEAFVDAVEHRGASHTALVPTMVARLLGLPGLTPARLSGLKLLGYAGAPMPPELLRQAYRRLTRNLVQYYGLVEAIPPVTVLDAADHARGLHEEPSLLASAGRAALGVELRVADADGRELPPGEVGEVVTRGEHVMAGYWNAEGRADLSKAVVDGWLHTGDLGRMDATGRLWLVDRKGDMIISGGYNIYPREVEEVLAEVPGVHEVAVLGAPDPDWGQAVVAFYTVRPGATVTDAQLLEHCRTRMASYKKPKRVHRLEEFPLNSTGKIAKKQLREQL